LNRRRFVTGSGAALAGLGAAGLAAPPRAPAQSVRSFSRVVDLTHTLHPDFPTFAGRSTFALEQFLNYEADGYNSARWVVDEHTGTHMDAPIHFARDARDAAEVPIEQLVVPLVVVDIRAKAAGDPDAQLTPADLEAWEGAHGPIPEGACVAMNSGWDAKADGAGFRNADADGVMHFPGFHVEAADFLLREREVVGIAVDTLSLDYGPSADFAVHYGWLPANRWGMECVANLGALPAAGATLVAGGPKVAGATGGPSRIVALV
jgi:kynurenine formamidase